ncbi:hypothetical protein B0H17DRAFT_1145282 [Mycena rosella]|uniref:Uncharacterized protein n=1 Tax=Mycena rosella TaxID=1033263 RepID=A0AAD7CR82_MYCRO|nr:hypothetical protein B0H17DRAFT_1145282 [Mycena rosella]
MWGIFDETGIFLALCRHRFVLLLCDMIRSGELAKYPLAIIDELLDCFPKKSGLGYNVGCHLEVTIHNSNLGPRAKEWLLKMLVGAFHGHAHNRLCQFQFLATYIEGLGLEDLEGRFHRQQEITTYIKHFDSMEMYANLSKFLSDNYEQALGILRTKPVIKNWMRSEGIISVNKFHQWLAEEMEWFLMKKNTAAEQVITVEMDYVQKLVNLGTSKAKLSTVSKILRAATVAESSYDPAQVNAVKRAKCHAEKVYVHDMEAVQDLENQLDLKERWTTDCEEYNGGPL